MKNIKSIIVIVLVIAMMTLVCGCNKNNDALYKYNQVLDTTAKVINIKEFDDDISNLTDNDIETDFKVTTSQNKKVSFQFELDNIYPIKDMTLFSHNNAETTLQNIRVFYSINSYKWEELNDGGYVVGDNTKENEISFENKYAKYVKVMFDTASGAGNWGAKDNYGLSDVKFKFGNGFVPVVNEEYTSLFKRYEGWTGADGIFSFPINGVDRYGDKGPSLMVFSDTFIGSVDKETDQRINKHMINNSMALLEENEEGIDIEFLWGKKGENKLDSIFSPRYPDTLFVGTTPYNMVNGSGMSGYYGKEDVHTNISSETMFLTKDKVKEPIEITFDFESVIHISEMWVWNYNEHQEYFKNLEKRGLKNIKIFVTDDKAKGWTELTKDGYPYQLAMAQGIEAQPATNLNDGKNSPIIIDEDIRYLKVVADNTKNEGNWGSANDNENKFGLAEVRFYDDEDNFVYTQVENDCYDKKLSANESTSRYWLQDGVVIDDNLYIFPIIVKDAAGMTALSFQVTGVNMIKVPLVDGRPDFENQQQFHTPLFYKDDFNCITYFGAGVLNNTKDGGSFTPDEYIYVYGHTGASKRLTVARVKPESIEDFNQWEYYSKGDVWTKDISKVQGIYNGISSELSVASISNKTFGDKYMLVFMKDTVSGLISYATSDTPYGPFGDINVIYDVGYLGEKIFSYNAKAHPHLSNKGELLISYNVNSTDMSSFEDADIYRPRFINLIEVIKE